jgi:hypothetical protein
MLYFSSLNFFLLKRVKGQSIYVADYNKPQKRLYRTNPSIPRPESRHGTRSAVYEQIIELKKQNQDSNGKTKLNYIYIYVHLIMIKKFLNFKLLWFGSPKMCIWSEIYLN